jgi:hypothetical protein
MAKNTNKFVSNLKTFITNWKVLAVVAIIFAISAINGVLHTALMGAVLSGAVAVIAAYYAYKNKN